MSLINQIPFPAGFEIREIETNGATIHVRVGGHHGAAVVLLHGFGNTGDMWAIRIINSGSIEGRPHVAIIGPQMRPNLGQVDETVDLARNR
jgi:pimeloyl-ACP methyl ester carboxylesterase